MSIRRSAFSNETPATSGYLDTPVAKAPVTAWYTVAAGKIVRIRTYFDARPLRQTVTISKLMASR
jgi:hypothetical protein